MDKPDAQQMLYFQDIPYSSRNDVRFKVADIAGCTPFELQALPLFDDDSAALYWVGAKRPLLQPFQTSQHFGFTYELNEDATFRLFDAVTETARLLFDSQLLRGPR